MFVKAEEFQLNVRSNKQVLKDLAGLITEEIQIRNDPPNGWDFRFMILVAQWLVEQGGYTMTPQGFNPGNVVGSGDAGFFQRPYNTEFRNGVRVPAPEVKFAAYSSMKVATRVKFDTLRDRWSQAYNAVLLGGSSDEYVNGLYPGHGKDYATAPKSSYVTGLRYRLRSQVIPHYILACEDDIKEMDELKLKIPGRQPMPGESLDYSNDVNLNQNTHAVMENLLDELKKLQQRVAAGQGMLA
jgi:hypothetical protein